jgi:hypothetical protein
VSGARGSATLPCLNEMLPNNKMQRTKPGPNGASPLILVFDSTRRTTPTELGFASGHPATDARGSLGGRPAGRGGPGFARSRRLLCRDGLLRRGSRSSRSLARRDVAVAESQGWRGVTLTRAAEAHGSSRRQDTSVAGMLRR